MIWQDFYKLPLMIDEYGGNVIAQHGDMGYRWAFDWIENDWIDEYPIDNRKGAQLADQIVRVLNRQSEYIPNFNWTPDEKDPTIICMNGQPCIEIRGWGELTGIGALHLPAKEAAKIQDDFKEYIIKTLNGN